MSHKANHFTFDPAWKVTDSLSPIEPRGYTATATGSPSWLNGADAHLSAREVLVRVLSGVAGVMLDVHQQQALMAVVEALPKDSNIPDLVVAIAGNDLLTNLRKGLQSAGGTGAYVDLFSSAKK